ncbi:hypothetical protein [Agrobacterium rosae]|uniref:hypothetical protein n=1 Tax=Agrobacterium rosae TaxID=1972867 RepID=UPI003B9ECFBB
MFKGLALMRKTSSKGLFNLASFHSPHSLTWSWILSLRFSERIGFKPHFRKAGGSLCVGFGNVLSAYAYKSNSGLEWQINVLTVGLHYSPQQPMWFRDMFWRADDEREALRRRVRQLERQVEAMPPSAKASSQPSAHLH